MAEAQVPAGGDEKGERTSKDQAEGQSKAKATTARRKTPGGGEALVTTGPSSEDEPAQKKAVEERSADVDRLTPAQYDTDGWDDIPAQMRS